MHRVGNRRGVTLIEVIIALAISGLAMLGCIMLLDQLNDSQSRITRERAADATAGNGDRLFRRLLIDAHTTTDTAERFRGDEYNASYLSFCDVPSGWPEACLVRLSLDSLRDSSVIVADIVRGASVDERFDLRRIPPGQLPANGRARCVLQHRQFLLSIPHTCASRQMLCRFDEMRERKYLLSGREGISR